MIPVDLPCLERVAAHAPERRTCHAYVQPAAVIGCRQGAQLCGLAKPYGITGERVRNQTWNLLTKSRWNPRHRHCSPLSTSAQKACPDVLSSTLGLLSAAHRRLPNRIGVPVKVPVALPGTLRSLCAPQNTHCWRLQAVKRFDWRSEPLGPMQECNFGIHKRPQFPLRTFCGRYVTRPGRKGFLATPLWMHTPEKSFNPLWNGRKGWGKYAKL